MTNTMGFRKFLWIAPAVLCIILLLAGCPMTTSSDNNGTDSDKGKDTTDTSAGIDWTNYETAGTYSVRVRNDANRDLVVFKDSPAPENLLGGVKKNEGNHGLPLKTSLFTANADFALVFLTLEDYNTYKDNLHSRAQYPFARVFAVYNKNGTNEVPFLVDSKLGGTNKLILDNMTSYSMEIRRNSPRGETLGYAPFQSNNTVLNIVDGDYNLFVVFKKYNPLRDEIITMYPKAPDGLPIMIDYALENGTSININAGTYTSSIANLSSGYAYLVVKNNMASGGLRVLKGSEVQKTATGIATINSGESRTYLIPMDATVSGDHTIYSDTTIFAGWKVGPTNRDKEIPVSDALKGDGDQNIFKSDYTYTVTVTGDPNKEGITVSDPVESEEKIEL
ncbi:MAG: hypothetical protein LBK00_00095 [Treponema sp.]|nr:hypothetical protein [Treponema sp.]